MTRAVNQALFYSLLGVLGFVTFSTYVGLGNALTPKKVFTVISIFAIARLYHFQSLVYCTIGLSDVWVASKRIEVRSSGVGLPLLGLYFITRGLIMYFIDSPLHLNRDLVAQNYS